MENTVGLHVHGSSFATLTDLFTSSGPLAILSIISDKCRRRHAWDISTDKSAAGNDTVDMVMGTQVQTPRVQEGEEPGAGTRAGSGRLLKCHWGSPGNFRCEKDAPA